MTATLPRPARSRRLPSAELPDWPLVALFALAPLWWALGVGEFLWGALAVPLAVALATRPTPVRVYRGFGWYVLFLGWMTATIVSLDSAPRLVGFTLRMSYYVGAAIVLLAVLNRRDDGGRRVVALLTALWAAAVAFGWLALLVGDVSWRSPVAGFLPAALAENALVADTLRPGLADLQDFIGYEVPRPKAPFVYTNGWGSVMALLTPVALAMRTLATGRTRRLVTVGLVASVLPMVVSLNRGLWLSLVIIAGYAAIRQAARGDVRALGSVLGALAVAGALLLLTPLGGVIADRLDTGHSDSERAALYTEVLDRSQERPVLGYGAPRPSIDGRLSVGTHGQLWFLIFAHGYPGALLYITALVVLAWRTRRYTDPVSFWCHVTVVVSIVHLPFYSHFAAPIVVVMAAAGVALRRTTFAAPSDPATQVSNAA